MSTAAQVLTWQTMEWPFLRVASYNSHKMEIVFFPPTQVKAK